MRLIEALQRSVLLGDGACGTVLQARGFATQPYDLANLQEPDLVVEVHRQYLEAGADFLETNTFASNRFKLPGASVSIGDLNLAGAALARKAAGSEGLVLGSIGPAGKPMAPIGSVERSEVAASAAEQASALAEGGVDGFILETFMDLEELAAAVEGVRNVSSLPIVACKAFIEDGEALSGGLPTRCAEVMSLLDVAAIGANCVVGPQRMLDLVRMMSEGTTLPIVAMPTPGMPQLVKGALAYDIAPEYFGKAALRLVEEGARMVGGCCGTTPAHIRALRDLLDKGPVKVKPRAASAALAADRAPLEQSAPTEFKRKLDEGRFVKADELDPPRGLKLDRFFEAIRGIRDSGADVINISDGARARLRMNPTAMCHRIQTQMGIEATMHFACRDRNLLAIQADLLGCHSLGVRNILAVTGDPANIGDYPSATSVFDVDAIGLARILARMNDGVDMAGYSVGLRCGFTICVAFNPTALEPSVEMDRIERKAAAGAQVMYTQPVFEECHAERAIETARRLGMKCLVGVMPLRSAKHAEFMHHEVPGITVPERLRATLAEASDERAQELGVGEACRLGAFVRSSADGLYLMTPANSAEIAARVMEAAR